MDILLVQEQKKRLESIEALRKLGSGTHKGPGN
jgi:hypothetical protein